MPTENKLAPSQPEMKRWQLKGFIPGAEGESKAVFRPVVVLADDFDRIAAERDALQLRLNAAAQRIDDGRVAMILAKRGEYPADAHSSCTYGVQPDTDFDRYQWSPSKLWEIVADVMLGQKVMP